MAKSYHAGTAFIKVTPDFRGFRRDLNRQVKQALKEGGAAKFDEKDYSDQVQKAHKDATQKVNKSKDTAKVKVETDKKSVTKAEKEVAGVTKDKNVEVNVRVSRRSLIDSKRKLQDFRSTAKEIDLHVSIDSKEAEKNINKLRKYAQQRETAGQGGVKDDPKRSRFYDQLQRQIKEQDQFEEDLRKSQAVLRGIDTRIGKLVAARNRQLKLGKMQPGDESDIQFMEAIDLVERRGIAERTHAKSMMDRNTKSQKDFLETYQKFQETYQRSHIEIINDFVDGYKRRKKIIELETAEKNAADTKANARRRNIEKENTLLAAQQETLENIEAVHRQARGGKWTEDDKSLLGKHRDFLAREKSETRTRKTRLEALTREGELLSRVNGIIERGQVERENISRNYKEMADDLDGYGASARRAARGVDSMSSAQKTSRNAMIREADGLDKLSLRRRKANDDLESMTEQLRHLAEVRDAQTEAGFWSGTKAEEEYQKNAGVLRRQIRDLEVERNSVIKQIQKAENDFKETEKKFLLTHNTGDEYRQMMADRERQDSLAVKRMEDALKRNSDAFIANASEASRRISAAKQDMATSWLAGSTNDDDKAFVREYHRAYNELSSAMGEAREASERATAATIHASEVEREHGRLLRDSSTSSEKLAKSQRDLAKARHAARTATDRLIDSQQRLQTADNTATGYDRDFRRRRNNRPLSSAIGQGLPTHASLGDLEDRLVHTGRLIAATASIALAAGAAIAGLGAVSLAPVIGSLSQMVGILGMVPALAASAAAGVAAIAVGSQGVGKALSAGFAALDKPAQAGGGGDNGAAAKAAEALAKRQRQAARSLDDARRQAARTAESGAKRIADAQARVVQAEEKVGDAQRNAKRAQDALNDARRTAKERLEGISLSLKGMALDEEGAALALERAKERLAEVNKDPKASALDRKEADLAVRQQIQSIQEMRNEHKKTREEYAKERREGVEGSAEVRDAKQGVVDAQKGVQDAIKGVADAQADLADTRKSVAQANEDAARRIADAEENLAEAMNETASSAGGAAASVDEYADALAKLSPSARALVEQIIGLRDAWHEMQVQVQERLFEGTAQAVLLLATTGLPRMASGLGQVADALNDSGLDIFARLSSSYNDANFVRIFEGASIAMGGLGRATADVLDGMLQLSATSMDFMPRFADWIENAADRFNTWITASSATGELNQFLETAIDKTTQLGRIFRDTGKIIHGVFSAGTDQGGLMLDTFEKYLGRMVEKVQSPEMQDKFSSMFRGAKSALDELWTYSKRTLGLIADIVVPAFRNWSTVIKPVTELIIDAITAVNDILGKVGLSAGNLLGAFMVFRTVKPVFDYLTKGWAAVGNMVKWTRGEIQKTVAVARAEATKNSASMATLAAPALVGASGGGAMGRVKAAGGYQAALAAQTAAAGGAIATTSKQVEKSFGKMKAGVAVAKRAFGGFASFIANNFTMIALGGIFAITSAITGWQSKLAEVRKETERYAETVKETNKQIHDALMSSGGVITTEAQGYIDSQGANIIEHLEAQKASRPGMWNGVGAAAKDRLGETSGILGTTLGAISGPTGFDLGDGIMGLFGADTSKNTRQWAELREQADRATASLKKLKEVGADAGDLGDFLASMDQQSFNNFIHDLEEGADVSPEFTGELRNLRAEIQHNIEKAKILGPGYQEITDAFNNMKDAARGSTEELRALLDIMEEMKGGKKNVDEARASITESVEALKQGAPIASGGLINKDDFSIDVKSSAGAALFRDIEKARTEVAALWQGAYNDVMEKTGDINQATQAANDAAREGLGTYMDGLSHRYGEMPETLRHALEEAGFTFTGAKLAMQMDVAIDPASKSAIDIVTRASAAMSEGNSTFKIDTQANDPRALEAMGKVFDVVDKNGTTTTFRIETSADLAKAQMLADIMQKVQDPVEAVAILNDTQFRIDAANLQGLRNALDAPENDIDTDVRMELERFFADGIITQDELARLDQLSADPTVNAIVQQALDGFTAVGDKYDEVQTRSQTPITFTFQLQGMDDFKDFSLNRWTGPQNADGGLIRGPGSDRSDNILGISKDGVPTSWVSPGEFVVNAQATRKHFGLIQAINAGLPGFADGGALGDVANPALVGLGDSPQDRNTAALVNLTSAIQNLDASVRAMQFGGVSAPADPQLTTPAPAQDLVLPPPSDDALEAPEPTTTPAPKAGAAGAAGAGASGEPGIDVNGGTVPLDDLPDVTENAQDASDALAGLGNQAQVTTDSQVVPSWSQITQMIQGDVQNVLIPKMADTGKQVGQMGTDFVNSLTGQVTPQWNAMAANMQAVKQGTIDPTFTGIQGGLGATQTAFSGAVSNITGIWDQMREATAAPVRWSIVNAFNDGVVGSWNSLSDLLGTEKMAPYPVRFATGGYVRGPGSSTSDSIPARLSDGEFVLNARAVKAAGVENLTAFNNAARRGPVSQQGMFVDGNGEVGGMFSDGGPARDAILRAQQFVAAQNGKPYQWAGPSGPGSSFDCTGLQASAIAVIQGKNPWQRYFYTGDFNGGPTGPMGLVRGLGPGYSIGVHHNPGGPGGGHAAGTLGGGFGTQAVNIESGGGHNSVAYGGPAVGADSPQFPWQYHLPLGPGGDFVSGGPGDGSGGVAFDPRAFVESQIGPIWDRVTKASEGLNFSGLVSGIVPGYIEKTRAAVTDKLSEMARDVMGSIGGGGAEQWRMLAIKAMQRVGFNWQDPRQVDAMLSQIMSESTGNPNAVQQVQDINSGGNEGVGLLQIIPTTYEAHRDPELPNDRRDPFSNMVAALRYYKSKYGMDLTTMWGHGHGYDQGGIFPSGTIGFNASGKPEAVFTNDQWKLLEDLVETLVSGDFQKAIQTMQAAAATVGTIEPQTVPQAEPIVVAQGEQGPEADVVEGAETPPDTGVDSPYDADLQSELAALGPTQDIPSGATDEGWTRDQALANAGKKFEDVFTLQNAAKFFDPLDQYITSAQDRWENGLKPLVDNAEAINRGAGPTIEYHVRDVDEAIRREVVRQRQQMIANINR